MSERAHRFTHLPNVTSCTIPVPVELAPGHSLVRAPKEHARFLRATLSGAGIGILGTPGEFEFTIGDNFWALMPYEMSTAQNGDSQHLPPESWRYFGILSESGAPEEAVAVTRHALLNAGLFLPHAAFEDGVAVTVGGNAGAGLTISNGFLRASPTRRPVELRLDDIDMLQEVAAALSKHDSAIVDLALAMGEMRHMRTLDEGSKLRVLGYFAIVESLLTHKPKGTDPYESIGRQIRTKMILIGNRTGFEREYSKHFGQMKPENVWKQLYDYRSDIAHGGGTGPAEGLKGIENIIAFLLAATTSVMRLCLDEPVLMRDLKNC